MGAVLNSLNWPRLSVSLCFFFSKSERIADKTTWAATNTQRNRTSHTIEMRLLYL